LSLQAVAALTQRITVRRNAVVCAAGVCCFAASMVLSAHVRIPLTFSPVPLTLQTMIVLLSGAALGAWGGAASQALYLAAGAAGLPVFTSGGGFAAFAGPTAGYLLAFPLAAWLMGRAMGSDRRWAAPVAAAGGALLIELLGAGWLVAGCHQALGTALMLGVVPFLAGDALKVAAVTALARPSRRAYRTAAGLH